MDQNRLDQLALHCIPGIGSVTIRQLISYCGSASAVWSSSKKRLMSIPGIGPYTYLLLRQRHEALEAAAKIYERAEKDKVQLLFHSDPEFPSRLRQIPDAPSLLYFKGKASFNRKYVIAVVGTRRSTAYGKHLTHKLIDELKTFNPLIISGLAYGIDISAHRHALASDLPTVGILAGGINRIYPSDHMGTAQKMMEKGGLLSEHPLDAVAEAHRFPARNRIIAGIADAVVVVEARETGGALITARLANDYSREVFAYPGPVHAESSKGCHKLINRNQAHLITSGKDLAEIMNWEVPTGDSEIQKAPPDPLPVPLQRVYEFLKIEDRPVHLDQISWSTNLTIHETATALLQLEFRGLVRMMPGNRYLISR